MAEKWAVLVVHGVGDSQPGATVDALVSSLAESNKRVSPDGNILMLHLPDKDVGWLIKTYQVHRERTPREAIDRLKEPTPMLTTFPMHFRRATLKVDSGPRVAIIAEVHWADLSTIRKGTLSLILSLLATVFSLRHIAEQAVDSIPWKPARWMRTIVFFSTTWLSGPIAALYGLMLYVLTCYYLLVFPLKQPFRFNGPISAVTEGLLLIPSTFIALIASLYAYTCCLWRNSGSIWTRLWTSFCIVSGMGFAWAIAAAVPGNWSLIVFIGITGILLIACALVLRLWPQDFWVLVVFPLVVFAWATAAANPEWPSGVGQWRLFQLLREGGKDRFHPDLPTHSRFLECAVWLLYTLDFSFAVLGALLLIGFVLWFSVRSRGDKGPALDAAYGTALAQAWLWLLVIPSLRLVAIRTFLRDQVASQTDFLSLAPMHRFLLINVIFSAVFIVFGLIVYWKRSTAGQRGIPRLITHNSILWVLVVVYNLGSLFVLANYANYLRLQMVDRILEVVPPDLILIITWIVTVLAGAATLFVTHLRFGLHIVQDVINHFYRRWEPVPWPCGQYFRTDVTEFETQQLIEARFRAVLRRVFEFDHVTHLTIISHSQGTMVAVDVLNSLSRREETEETEADISDKLQNLHEFHLITMGSPLSHLYQHYFPGRYPSFTSREEWKDLKKLTSREEDDQTGRVRNWVNIYRIDDYVGTDIQGDGRWPQNVAIKSGGHIGYWKLREVFECPQVKEALPGK